jgi:hypothetical protein
MPDKHNEEELNNHLLTINEVASLIRVHPVTVRRWEKQGILKSCRIGPRISSINAWKKYVDMRSCGSIMNNGGP